MGLERLASVVQQVPLELRHRPVRRDPRADARAPRPRPRRVRGGALQLPGHRRPLARGDVPHRRRRAARRTRAAATCCGGSSAARSGTAGCSGARSRSSPRRPRSSSTSMADAYPHLRENEAVDPRRDRPRGGAVHADARGGHGPARGGADPADLGRAQVVGRRRDDLPADAPVLPGDVAFRLHDTYGFPIDLTVELAAEYGVRVDRAGFDAALAEQRERSRVGQEGRPGPQRRVDARCTSRSAAASGDTKFVGYETTTAEAKVVAILRDGIEYEELEAQGRRGAARRGGRRRRDRARSDAVLPRGRRPGRRTSACCAAATGASLFEVDGHAARGGHAGRGPDRPSRHAARPARGRRHRHRRGRRRPARPHDAQPHGHAPAAPRAPQRRRRVARSQAGSLVAPDYLRFDFPFDRALTDDEKRAIEDEVREIDPRGPAGHGRVPADGRGHRARRRRVLRREVRRDGPDGPGRGLQLRAVRRHALPRHRPDRQLRHHGRAEHRLGHAPDRGAHRGGRGRAPPTRGSRARRAADAVGATSPRPLAERIARAPGRAARRRSSG